MILGGRGKGQWDLFLILRRAAAQANCCCRCRKGKVICSCIRGEGGGRESNARPFPLPFLASVQYVRGWEGFWTTLIVKKRFVIGKVCPCLQRDGEYDSSYCPTTEIASSSFCSLSQPVAARDGPSPGAGTLGQARRDQRKARLFVGLSDDSPGVQARPGPWA